MKEVKLIAVSPKYKKHPLVLTAPTYGNTFITGQEYLASDEKTIGGLTANQMLGIEELSKEQKEKYPYVLKPDVYYHFSNNMTFNLDNPEHVTKLNFLMKVCPDIAKSKAEFVRGKHSHYIYDKVNEATHSVRKADLIYEAMSKVKKSSYDTVVDVASYLSYIDVDFHVNVNSATRDEVFQAVYNACEKNPQTVIDCFTKDIREEILVVKMIKTEVIKKNKDGFEDNGTYLGKTINDIIEFARRKENAGRLSRWESLANRMNSGAPASDTKIDDYLTAFESAIRSGNAGEAMVTNRVLDEKQLSESQRNRFMELKSEFANLQQSIVNKNEELLQQAKDEAREKYEAMEIDDLKKLCGEKRIKGDLWKEKEKEEIIEVLLEKVKL